MVRKTVTLPESTVELVRDRQLDGESFSAAVARLIEEGARLVSEGSVPSWIGSGEGTGDLSQRVEEILKELYA
jgi:dsDNA-specific endonuclease/ATPase MutS2